MPPDEKGPTTSHVTAGDPADGTESFDLEDTAYPEEYPVVHKACDGIVVPDNEYNEVS